MSYVADDAIKICLLNKWNLSLLNEIMFYATSKSKMGHDVKSISQIWIGLTWLRPNLQTILLHTILYWDKKIMWIENIYFWTIMLIET